MAVKAGIPSERVGMMQVARDIVGLVFHKDHVEPSPYKNGERQLTDREKKLYDAAVQFLTKEFNIGSRSITGEEDEDLPGTGKDPVKEPVKP